MEENGIEGCVNKEQKKFGWGGVISQFYSMEACIAHNSAVYASKYLEYIHFSYILLVKDETQVQRNNKYLKI